MRTCAFCATISLAIAVEAAPAAQRLSAVRGAALGGQTPTPYSAGWTR